ncbi:MAG: hypothetical protein HC798_04235 [Polaribacter sp.]|nr:hypothetical protein [Polaribacter sp.]
MKLKYLVFFLFIIFTQIINSQLSRKHYIPPLTSGDDFREQFIYISTPKANNVSYKIIPVGNTNLPQYSGIVSNSNPVIQPILDESGTIDLDNDTQLHINRTNLTGAKITNKGFIIEASDVIYVSVRVLTSALNSGNPVHAGALVSKGNAALGKEFRVGAFVNEPNITNLHTAFVSMMATEDNTTITFDNSLNGLNLPSGVPIPNNIILDEAESFIIAIGGNGTDLRNLIGTLVSSDKT